MNLRLLLTAVVLALAASAALGERPTTQPAQRLEFRSTPAVGARALARAGEWGGLVTAKTGETVRVFVSDTYPVDPAFQREVADFVVDLYHGAELASATFYIEPPSEIRRLCAPTAAGCYSPEKAAIVAPGEDLPDGVTRETVLAHEYGHHVAANRDNRPWPALEWGTKRWATHANVCARKAAGSALPGDERSGYRLNPAEAFAEAYRLLNYQRQSWPSWPFFPWIADQSFYPDAAALEAVRQDVLEPWSGPRATAWAGRIGAKELLWKQIETPLDGTLKAVIARAPRDATLSLTDASGRVLVRPTRRPISFVVCGQRSIALALSAPAGGDFSVTISAP